MRELNADIKRHQVEREGLGVNLYEVQQELGRQQANLEDEHDKLAKESQNRRRIEKELEESRRTYKSGMDQISAGMKRNQELQTENEATASKLFAMQHAKEDVRGDIQVMRRAAEKADAEPKSKSNGRTCSSIGSSKKQIVFGRRLACIEYRKRRNSQKRALQGK